MPTYRDIVRGNGPSRRPESQCEWESGAHGRRLRLAWRSGSPLFDQLHKVPKRAHRS
jgi:hypothetical protein